MSNSLSPALINQFHPPTPKENIPFFCRGTNASGGPQTCAVTINQHKTAMQSDANASLVGGTNPDELPITVLKNSSSTGISEPAQTKMQSAGIATFVKMKNLNGAISGKSTSGTLTPYNYDTTSDDQRLNQAPTNEQTVDRAFQSGGIARKTRKHKKNTKNKNTKNKNTKNKNK